MAKGLLHTFIVCICLVINLQAQAQSTEEIEFESDAWKLKGTLSLPAGAGPFPAVVIVHGSGPVDRDMTLPMVGGNADCLYPGLSGDTIRTYRDLADGLVRNGIAVLRYDKRTLTYGSALPQEELTPLDFADDAVEAVNYLMTRNEIDWNRIVLLGHSQGAQLIPIAGIKKQVAALVSLAGPVTPIDTLLAEQTRYSYYACLNDTPAGQTAYHTLVTDFGAMRTGTWSQKGPYMGAYPLFWRDWMRISDSIIINYSNSGTPTLFLHGTDDLNVPVEDAHTLYKEVESKVVDLMVFHGLNHYFTTASMPRVPAYVADTIAWWLSSNGIITSVGQKQSLSPQFRAYTTTGQIIVECQAAEPVRCITLYDLNGRAVLRQSISGSASSIRIPSSHLPKGIYVVGMQTAQGQGVQKVAVQ